eukprot:g7149.t1
MQSATENSHNARIAFPPAPAFTSMYCSLVAVLCSTLDAPKSKELYDSKLITHASVANHTFRGDETYE